MLNVIIRADHALFFLLNGMASFMPLAVLAEELSMLGRYPIVLVTGLVLALDGWPSFRRHALALLMVVPLALGVNITLKYAIDRDRPLAFFSAELERGTVHINALEQLGRNSFPSGHTLLSFFAMGYLAWARRRHAVWALALAVGVGWSRVAMGSHFPLDCLAGACMGFLWAWLAWRIYLYREHGSWTNRSGRMPTPGLSSGSSSVC